MGALDRNLLDLVTLARRHGPRALVHELDYRVSNFMAERRLRVRTNGLVPIERIAPGEPELRDSTPIGYRAVTAALRSLPIDRARAVFLDYGCGKGRACLVAARLGFARVIGVELSELLAGTARANLAGMRGRRTERADVVVADARTFAVPPDVAVVYFFNPFVGRTLETVVTNLRRSVLTAPRELWIVFFNNGEFDRILTGASWLEKREQRSFYPRLSCGIYRCPAGEPPRT